jgi:excinuclease ABC subunit C
LNTLQKVFLLRSCSDKEVEAGDRPCLNYHLKRCSGPCGGKISKADYKLLVQAADNFLTGKSTNVQEKLSLQMKQASEEMEFERAAALRDRIRALAQVQSNQGINPRTVSEADVISLHLDAGQACVQVFFIRANQNWGNVDFYPRVSSDMSHDEVLEAFLGQFYSTKEPPRQIILSHGIKNLGLMKELLTEKLGRNVKITVPQRGESFDLMVSALRNAKESLARKMANTASQRKLLKGLAEAFGMAMPPKRVEVYDNSHIQGEFAVGAMIASGPDGFMKNNYRKFNIIGDNLKLGDDFGMMREVLSRRFKRLLKEDPDRKKGQWPDLLLIDGGAGHVSAVSHIMKDFGIKDIAMVGVAKGIDRNHGKEEFHIGGRNPFALRKNDPVLYFVQRLRDEAHRFAIGTHRAKRSKAISASPLDEIPGVGASRKSALLRYFGSSKGVKRAHLSDLKSVEGVSSALAERIYNYFNEN